MTTDAVDPFAAAIARFRAGTPQPVRPIPSRLDLPHPPSCSVVAGAVHAALTRSAAEEDAAWLALVAACDPADEARLRTVLAEVERRWESYAAQYHTVPGAHRLGRAGVYDSVRRDVAAGLL